MKVVISSGHGKYIRGASCDEPWGLDEVDEARRVVEKAAEFLRARGVTVTTYHDDVSTSQNENLNRIVDFHNSKTRDLDVSVHFNCYETTNSPRGCEVLYVSSSGFEMADEIVGEICINSGLIDRGAKKRTDLFFLNNTEMPAVLIETCFVDSRTDADIYGQKFDVICEAIAAAISGEQGAAPEPPDPEEPEEPTDDALLHVTGKCSEFGGPSDLGVSASEGLAFLYEWQSPYPFLFLPYQPDGTSGLARRLNPFTHYVACRWDYSRTPKEMLRGGDVALVRSVGTGIALTAFPADWGPHEDTGRVADLSPSLMADLALTTDDEVEVIYPWTE